MTKIGTSKHINKTIDDHQFHIKKKFGQNFLKDQNILEKIARLAAITNDTLVIEIGPGLGSLTEHLIKQAKHVLAYEIDQDLIPILTKQFKDMNITLLHQDFLKTNIDEDIKQLSQSFERVIVVANLPYYITTPIILKLLEESTIVTEYYVMMQLEVARRFTSEPSTKDYNSLSVFMQYKTDSSIIMTVPRTVFVPEPNVDSAVVKIKIKDQIERFPVNEKLFYQVVQNAFSMRRKTLVNNLSKTMNYPKTTIIDMLEELGYNPQIRAEALQVDDFIHIADYLNQL